MKGKSEKTIVQSYDVAVVGGGMAGLCAALAAARGGVKTLLLQDRPVLGGNASSEVRMHICGASRHGSKPNRRETGILEEILLENKFRNPEHSYALFDSLLWEKAMFQDNLTVLLNTYMYDVQTADKKIVRIFAHQLTTEKRLEITAGIFIDCTGDGTLAYKAGADYMFGREDKTQFGEPFAVSKADTVTMGNSVMFRAIDVGHPVPFVRPPFAYEYSDAAWAKENDWTDISSGYWWLELGGTQLNCLRDSEQIKDELLKVVFGVWDYIKNSGDSRADNLVLDWVGMIPAKRETRRIVGGYVLTENDIEFNTQFEDAVGYGGWHIDAHPPERFLNTTVRKITFDEDITRHLDNDVYQIPYRSLYSKDVENLMLGGRIVSVSHRAFASVRVMGTLSVLGQAAGTAAAMSVREGLTPAGLTGHIGRLQQQLLKDDCYIPGVRNEDETDLARTAAVSCSSQLPGCGCENVVNGIARTVGGDSNMWAADCASSPWIGLRFDRTESVQEVRLTFDSDLSAEIMPTLSEWVKKRQSPGVPDTLVADYKLELLDSGRPVRTIRVTDNHLRLRVHRTEPTPCDEIRLTITRTQGNPQARLFEIRVY